MGIANPYNWGKYWMNDQSTIPKSLVNGIFGDYPVDEGYKFDVNAYEVTQDQFN